MPTVRAFAFTDSSGKSYLGYFFLEWTFMFSVVIL